jgi:hypothetical protein
VLLDSACHDVRAVAGSLNPVMKLGVRKEEAGNWRNKGNHNVFYRNVGHSNDRTQGRSDIVITAQ